MTKVKSEVINKFLQSIILLSGSVWLGSQITKVLTIYYFFQTDEFGNIFLRSEVNSDTIHLISYQFAPIFSITLISYTVFILFVIIYSFFIRKSIKQLGWLFISIMIIFLCVPIEIYLMKIDFKLFEYSFYRTGDSATFLSLFSNRVQSLSSFPIISIILHFIVIFLIIFKPLDKRGKIEN